VDREYYQPVPRGFEQQLAERLVQLRQLLKSGPGTPQPKQPES
jgi:hypothetical protein